MHDQGWHATAARSEVCEGAGERKSARASERARSVDQQAGTSARDHAVCDRCHISSGFGDHGGGVMASVIAHTGQYRSTAQ